jgi:hypothetical protein
MVGCTDQRPEPAVNKAALRAPSSLISFQQVKVATPEWAAGGRFHEKEPCGQASTSVTEEAPSVPPIGPLYV